MTDKNDVELARKRLQDPYWRINNLYQIVDKTGQKITFNLNWAQEELYNNLWYCNVILKARQLGMSTFICMLFLDRCLFNPNLSAGIIAHTVEDAQAMFRKVKIAYDSLPAHLKALLPAETDTAQMLKFSNGSSIRVGTSLRSSTFQYLHISEFGKICAKYPDKAQEIITGSLNTVAPGQYIFIESTAEGREGPFYDICRKAQQDKESKRSLSKLDFRFHFFPWYGEPIYRSTTILPVSLEMQNYFDHLLSINVKLDEEQKNWYITKAAQQKDGMKREFPSTPEESWEVTNEGLYYCKQMNQARAEGRMRFLPYDDKLPVHTAWDLGFNDSNAIIYFQIFRNEIRIIDYDEGSGESLQHWIGVMKNKDYTYGKHIAPHDIMVHELTTGISRQKAARDLGVILLASKRHEVNPGIDEVRNILPRCFFDEAKCEKIIKALDCYKKDWNERDGRWSKQPAHTWASHGADAFRTLATGLHYVTNQRTEVDVQKDNARQQDYFKNRYNITR